MGWMIGSSMAGWIILHYKAGKAPETGSSCQNHTGMS